jgi:hypothetical protein
MQRASLRAKLLAATFQPDIRTPLIVEAAPADDQTPRAGHPGAWMAFAHYPLPLLANLSVHGTVIAWSHDVDEVFGTHRGCVPASLPPDRAVSAHLVGRLVSGGPLRS